MILFNIIKMYILVQVHLNTKIRILCSFFKFIFPCNLFQKVKRSYILDTLHVK